MTLYFDWDEKKAKANIQKHGISFFEASSVFDDKNAKIFFDPKHSQIEDRFIIIGYSKNNNLLFVSFTERNYLIRIISARKASKKERETHETQKK